MRYTLTMRDEDLQQARRLCFSVPNVEGACFLLCGESHTSDEIRLLCQQVLPVVDDAYLTREPTFLSLDSPCYVTAAKMAREQGLSIVFVHSHPGGFMDFSEQDNREEPKLQEFFAQRVPGRVHGGLVLTQDEVFGRVWVGKGEFARLDTIRVIGTRFQFYFAEGGSQRFPEYFDRQVLAFGPEMQAVLSRLHIGIVGGGGTGSAVVEQLTRLGVGKLSVFDADSFEASNVNRVYGSGTTDAGRAKVDLAKRNVHRIGVGTKIHIYPQHITEYEAAFALRDCDIVFGCTDKEAPRGILCQLSIRYIIPVLDTGVVIESEDGRIVDVVGRVSTLYPGEACLFCRGRISADVIGFELLPEDEQQELIAEGYAPELAVRNPAVVTFTTAVAAQAGTELLHRLSGFMGAERESSEIVLFFDKSRLSTSRETSAAGCFCSDRSLWGSGDSERYLGMWG